MKVSLNWAQNLASADLRKIGDERLIDKIGSQLGAVDEIIEWGKRLEPVLVVKVVNCNKHPNADKLSVCLIDDGKAAKGVKRNKDGLVELVCGAPNVAAGMYAAWIPPDTAVPATIDSEPFVIEAREIRGVISNGMLASLQELGISDNHSGIVELQLDELAKGIKAGDSLAKALWLKGDIVVDIENKMFTHRPDCFGILGVARELAGIQGLKFTSPDWYQNAVKLPPVKQALKLTVKNEVPDLVPRFMAVSLGGVEVKPSPLWLQAHLARVGIRPINNIVDLTNYYMVLTGQPLHAYDYDKLAALDNSKSATLVARAAKKGETVRLLDGKQRQLEPGTAVIAIQKAVVGIGGVMGGANTEVDGNTKNIVLECANFDMYAIRRASMAHGVFSDAVARFNKGQSPHQNDRVLHKAAIDILQHAGGRIASKTYDIHDKLPANKLVKVKPDFINQRLGLKLSAKDICQFLQNVEFAVKLQASNSQLLVQAPFWRTDIDIPEDVVEEIGRLHGFDKLPLELPARSLRSTTPNDLLAFKQTLRQRLASYGANEVLSYSFVHGDLIESSGQQTKHAYQISNALSPELQYYRLSLTPSLLAKVHPNIKAGHNEFAIFEIGKAHIKGQMDETDPQVPAEEERLSLVLAADSKARSSNVHGAPYFWVRKYLDTLLDSLGIAYDIRAIDHVPSKIAGRQTLAPFEESRAGYIIAHTNGGEELLGFVGEFKSSTQKALKLPSFAAGFELSTIQLLKTRSTTSTYKPLPDFPKIIQDITFKTSVGVKFSDLLDKVKGEVGKLADKSDWAIKTLDIYQPEDDHKHRNITFRLNIASYERTLTDKEVNVLLEKVASSAKSALKATRI